MDSNSLKSLFFEVMENVLGLFPEPSHCHSAVVIFSHKQSHLSIPVFMGKRGIKFFCQIKKKYQFETVFWHRLCMIHQSTFAVTNDRGEERLFPFQMILNIHIWKYFQKDIYTDYLRFFPKINKKQWEYISEAYSVAYFLHEFRHIFQMTNGYDGLPVSEDRFPSLTNEIIPHDKLRDYWERYVQQNMRSYEKHYADAQEKNIFLLGERDALQIQLFAFDCWLTQWLTREERYARIREILAIK